MYSHRRLRMLFGFGQSLIDEVILWHIVCCFETSSQGANHQ